MSDDEQGCQHEFSYAGIRYNVDRGELPVKTIVYAHTYFCKRCMHHLYRICGKSVDGESLAFGATPDLNVPVDRA